MKRAISHAIDQNGLKRARVCCFLMALMASSVPTGAQSQDMAAYRAAADRIRAEATADGAAVKSWDRLAEMTDNYPARLSGSANLEKAIRWAAETMRRDGLSNVRLEEVMVPHWVRGSESAEITGPYPQPIAISALGGSVGGTVEAPVLVVKSFDDLKARAAEAKGRIVVYNTAYDETIDPGEAYGKAGKYRYGGASRAAAVGAVGALVRSVGPTGFRTPHTGQMKYDPGVAKIPVAALSAEDALMLQRMQDRGEKVTVRLALGARTLPDAQSANVIAELPGRERPDEVVLLSAHIDSWDVSGQPLDDGAGCVAVWEAVNLLKRLNLQPRRTIRVVLFTDEEMHERGAAAYRDRHHAELAKHVLAIDADTGMLPIRGYTFTGSPAARAQIEQFLLPALAPFGGTALTSDDHINNADIGPLVRAGNVPALLLDQDMRGDPSLNRPPYFSLHHTSADTVDKIDPKEMANVIAALATIAYVSADMLTTLDRRKAPAR